jgi:hypothetical protein
MVLRETRTTTLAGVTTRVLNYDTTTLAPFDYSVGLFPEPGGFKRYAMAISLDTALFSNTETRDSALSLLSMMGGLATLIIKCFKMVVMRLARRAHKYIVSRRSTPTPSPATVEEVAMSASV